MESWEKPFRRIGIAADHGGYELKERIKSQLKSAGVEAVDLGTHSAEAVDYPDYAQKLARMVSERKLEEGILVCGTGIGMSITANKFPGVRAAVATTPFMSKMARAHNNANILCLGARVVDEGQAAQIVDAWLGEPFEGGRHERRVEKMKELDRFIVPPTEPNK